MKSAPLSLCAASACRSGVLVSLPSTDFFDHGIIRAAVELKTKSADH